MNRIVLALLLISMSHLKAQLDSSIFKSKDEIKLFSEVLNGKSRFDIFLCESDDYSSEGKDFYEWIDKIYSELKAKKVDKRPPYRAISMINKHLQVKYLRVYQHIADVSDIYSHGVYNCVSGTILHALIFERFEIPYEIKKTPTHVFLLAYPFAEKIMVETTTPEGSRAIMKFDGKFKKDYAEYLVEQDVISDDKLLERGVDKIFDEYYFTEEVISLVELAGLQFYNLGLDYMMRERYKQAEAMFKRAQVLHDYRPIQFILQSISLIGLAKMKQHSFERVQRLIDLIEDDRTRESHADEMVTEVKHTMYHYIVDRDEPEKADSIFSMIDSTSMDSAYYGEVAFSYLYERARACLVQHKFEDAIPWALKAYQINPKHVHLKSIMSSALMSGFRKIRTEEEALAYIDELSTKYSFLHESPIFMSLKCVATVQRAYSNFEAGRITKGKEYITEFEKMYPQSDVTFLDENIIADAYMEWASFYIRKVKYQTAVNILRRGVKFASSNMELKDRLRSTKELL